MPWHISSMEPQYLLPALDLVEEAFSQWRDPREGATVRRLVQEIRAGADYLPALELLMVDGEADSPIGYAMFSRFSLEGRYDGRLLLLTPVAVKPQFQRQHISKALIEHGFELARQLGYEAVLVEGNPKNYTPRGFQPSYRFDILPGPNIHLPHPDCLMVKELVPGALEDIHGLVDYARYKSLS